MKHLTMATAVATAVVVAACAKTEQAPPSPPPGTAAGAAAPNPTAMPTPTSASADPGPPASADAPGRRLEASRAAEEACVDKWLAARRLDPYGNPLGTMYAGGTPLFDERTGEHVDRLAYVYKRQPLARAACRPTAVH
jgi:hypothetical protein